VSIKTKKGVFCEIPLGVSDCQAGKYTPVLVGLVLSFPFVSVLVDERLKQVVLVLRSKVLFYAVLQCPLVFHF
jgi:hypothetical protein